MKRKNYDIKYQGKVVKTVHAWNRVSPAIREYFRGIMTGPSGDFVESVLTKDEFGLNYVKGVYVWKDHCGKHYEFSAEIRA